MQGAAAEETHEHATLSTHVAMWLSSPLLFLCAPSSRRKAGGLPEALRRPLAEPPALPLPSEAAPGGAGAGSQGGDGEETTGRGGWASAALAQAVVAYNDEARAIYTNEVGQTPSHCCPLVWPFFLFFL